MADTAATVDLVRIGDGNRYRTLLTKDVSGLKRAVWDYTHLLDVFGLKMAVAAV